MHRPPVSAPDLEGMLRALDLARAAAARGEVPVGAVLMEKGAVLGEAHNETVVRNDPTAHAEFLAIRSALNQSRRDRFPDATLYVTLEPCAQCAGVIILAKVGRVVFGAWDPKAGMAGSVADLLRHRALNHRPEVLGGILEADCGQLLHEFFEKRRTT